MKRIIDKQTNMFIRDDFTFDENTEIGLDVEPSRGLYHPKWDGEKWIEGLSQAEIDAMKPPEPQPTTEERIEVLEMALLEVILGG